MNLFRRFILIGILIETCFSQYHSTEIQIDSHEISLPLAPFQIKIKCKNGLASHGKARDVGVCPDAATSCGFFKIPTPRGNIKLYECVDASIFSDENEGLENETKNTLFKSVCDHIPKCYSFYSNLLNPTFKMYLTDTYSLDSFYLHKNKITLCCSLNNALLDKVITNTSINNVDQNKKSDLFCDNKQCGINAIGCLTYNKLSENTIFNEIDNIVGNIKDDYEYEYHDSSEIETFKSRSTKVEEKKSQDSEYYIDPVQISFNEEFAPSSLYSKKRRSYSVFGSEAPIHLHVCVYPHLNDEVYRHCSMIYSNLNKNRCYKTKGYEICCCYVRPGKNTCNPSELEEPPKINVLAPKVAPAKMVKINRIVFTTSSPVTEKSVNEMITTQMSLENKSTNARMIIQDSNKMINKTKPIPSKKDIAIKRCKIINYKRYRNHESNKKIPHFYRIEVCNKAKIPSSYSKNMLLIICSIMFLIQHSYFFYK